MSGRLFVPGYQSIPIESLRGWNEWIIPTLYTVLPVVTVMDESNPYTPPRSPLSPPGDLKGRATVPGLVGFASASLGLLAFLGYGTFAARGIRAASQHDMVSAYRMARFAGGFSFAQLLLGLLAVGLGWWATARSERAAPAKGLGASALGLGVLVLLLLLVLV